MLIYVSDFKEFYTTYRINSGGEAVILQIVRENQNNAIILA